MDTTKLLNILSGKNVFDKYLELRECPLRIPYSRKR